MTEAIERAPANKVDQILLRNAASMSPAELSETIGGLMNPAMVAAHVKRLLSERDWLTQAELDNLTTFKMQAALVKLEGKFEDYENLGLQLKYLKEIGARLDKRRAATTVDLNSLYSNQGAIMAKAFDIALAYMRGSFREEIDADLWDEVAREALSHAAAELAKHEVSA